MSICQLNVDQPVILWFLSYTCSRRAFSEIIVQCFTSQSFIQAAVSKHWLQPGKSPTYLFCSGSSNRLQRELTSCCLYIGSLMPVFSALNVSCLFMMMHWVCPVLLWVIFWKYLLVPCCMSIYFERPCTLLQFWKCVLLTVITAVTVMFYHGLTCWLLSELAFAACVFWYQLTPGLNLDKGMLNGLFFLFWVSVPPQCWLDYRKVSWPVKY